MRSGWDISVGGRQPCACAQERGPLRELRLLLSHHVSAECCERPPCRARWGPPDPPPAGPRPAGGLCVAGPRAGRHFILTCVGVRSVARHRRLSEAHFLSQVRAA